MAVTAAELYKAALAYQKLSSCYRLGKQPTEALFKELDRARKVLEKYESEVKSLK